MIQGYHAYTLPWLYNWSASHFFPSRFVLCCVFWLVLFVCFALLFCFVFRFLLCDGIVTALDYVAVPPVYFCGRSISRRPSLRQLVNSLISAHFFPTPGALLVHSCTGNASVSYLFESYIAYLDRAFERDRPHSRKKNQNVESPWIEIQKDAVSPNFSFKRLFSMLHVFQISMLIFWESLRIFECLQIFGDFSVPEPDTLVSNDILCKLDRL